MTERVRTDGYYHKVDGEYRTSVEISMNHVGDIWYSEHFYKMGERGFWEYRVDCPNRAQRVKEWSRAVEMLTETVSRGGYTHSSEIKSGGVL